MQQNRKRLIVLVYNEYLQINMAKITIHGESWATPSMTYKTGNIKHI